MENYNTNNQMHSMYQPAIPNDSARMMSSRNNTRQENADVNRILNTTTVPQVTTINDRYLSNMASNNGGTNSSSTCTGNNCSYMPETVTNTEFFPAYLKKFIGYWVRLDFIIGTTIEQRVGQLLEVGASYVVIKVLEPETIMMCDLYSIKFVTIILNENFEKLYSF